MASQTFSGVTVTTPDERPDDPVHGLAWDILHGKAPVDTCTNARALRIVARVTMSAEKHLAALRRLKILAQPLGQLKLY